MRTHFSCLIVSLLLGLTACQAPEHSAQTLQTPPVVQVNTTLISSSELEQIVQQPLSTLTLEQAKPALTVLVEQELAQQAAQQAQLDLRPDIAAKLLNVNRQQLASAYIRQQTAHLKHPSERMVQTYYENHIERYQSNQTLYLSQISIPSKSVSSTLKSLISRQKLAPVIAWLQKNQIPYSQITANQESYRLSAELYQALIQNNQRFLKQEVPGQLVLIERLKRSSKPRSLQEVRTEISHLLYAQQQDQARKELIKQLRQNATIKPLHSFQ